MRTHGQGTGLLRPLAILLSLLFACVDGPTGPGSQVPARLRVDVLLPPGTPAAWLPAGDTLRILIRRAGRAEPILDTADLADPLSVQVPVPLAQAVERFVATAELAYGGQVLFLAFEAIQLRAGLDTTITLALVYVGPGGAAATLAVAAGDSTLERGDTTRVTSSALDSLGQALGRVPVRFRSLRPDLFQVDTAGLITALDGVPDSTLVDVVMPTGLTASLPLWLIPAFTPFGGQPVAFISSRDGNREVYAMLADGTGAVRLTESSEDEFFPAWAPDTSVIAFEREVNGARQIFTVALGSRTVTALTTGSDNTGPRYAPDGTRIGFTSRRSGLAEAWIMDADGGNQRRLAAALGDAEETAFGDWSPDGSQVLVLARQRGTTEWADAWVTDTSGAAPRLVLTAGEGVVPNVRAARWSPLGGEIVYTHLGAGGDTSVFATDLRYGSPPLAIPNTGSFDGNPAYAGGGDLLLYESDADGMHAIYRVDPGGAPLRLSPTAVAEFEPDHLPPALPIYVDRLDAGPPNAALTSDEASLVLTVQALNPRDQGVPGVPVTWQAGGDEIVVIGDTVFALGTGLGRVIGDYGGWRADTVTIAIGPRTGANARRLVLTMNNGLYTMRGDGADTIPLLADVGAAWPAYSPDGARIAFASSQSGNADVYVMNADGSGVTQLTSDPGDDTQPAWSPDGARIVFSSTRGGGPARYSDLWLMNADGSGVRRLTSWASVNVEGVDPAWSPDGSAILYVRYVRGNVNPELWMMSPDGLRNEEFVLPQTMGYRFPAWTPDGSVVVYTRSTNATGSVLYFGIGRAPFAPGAAETVLSTGSSPRFLTGGDFFPSVADDGLIVFSRGGRPFVMQADGGAQSALTGFASYARWRPDAVRPWVASVGIGGDVTTPIPIGATRQLTATGLDQNGAPITPRAGFQWVALDPAVARVDPSTGVVTGVATGASGIVVSSGVATPDTVTVTVTSGVTALTRTWVGGAAAGPTDWEVAANWSPAGVPGPGDTVIVPATADQPTLTAAATVARLRITGGGLALGGQTLTVTGDFSTGADGAFGGAAGRVIMQSSLDTLIVGGDATWWGDSEQGYLTAGVIRFRGDVRQGFGYSSTATFTAAGTHRTILDGTSPQTVTFDSPALDTTAAHFQDLEIANPAGVTFAGNHAVRGTLTVSAGAAAGSGTTVIAGSLVDPVGDRWQVTSTTFTGSPNLPARLMSNVRTQGGTVLDKDVVITGSLRVAQASLNLGGHALSVSGDLVTGEDGGFGAGVLVMQDPADSLTVGGGITFWGSSEAGLLTAGVIRVRGNFTQRFYYSSTASFTAGGTHRVVLDGSTVQTLAFDSPGLDATAAHFQDLELANGGGAIVVGGLVTAGRLRVTTPVALTGAVTATVADSLVTVPGSNLAPAVLRLGGGMAVAGAFNPPVTEFFGSGQTIQAGLPYTDVTVTGSAAFAGPTAIAGDVLITNGTGDLTLNGQPVTVGGNFQIGNFNIGTGGLLRMTDPADSLDIQGNAVFDGSSETGLLTAGVLVLRGDFSQRLFYSSASAFAAGGTHRTVFAGGAAQAVAFDTPGGDAASSHFQDLELANTGGGVTFSGAAFVNGELRAGSAGAQSAAGSGAALSVAGVDVDGLTLDGLPLRVGAGTLARFDNVTFQNIAPASTQLSIERGGGAFTFSGLRFLTTPTTGLYVSATDLAPADGDVLTVTLAGAVPADGTAYTATAGGAVVLWPGVPGSQRTWVGGAVAGPTDWALAANWSPAGVPGTADTVIVPTATDQPVLTANATVARVRITGGTLTLGGFTLVVDGDLSTEGATGRLVMQNGLDSVVVRGAATFAGAPLTGQLTAGVLVVAGDFSQVYVGSNWEAFQASGAHRTVLNGTAAQSVSFSSPGIAGQASFFHDLEIANGSGGVAFASNASVVGTLRVTTAAAIGGPGTLTVVDSLVTAPGSVLAPAGVRLGGGMNVTGTFNPPLTEFFGASQEIQGSLGYQSVLVTGQTVLAGPATVAGDLTIARIVNQPSGDLDLNGQALVVAGNLRTGQGSDPAGLLTMQDPADQLTVQGGATFAGAPMPGRLTAGTLRVRGDFTQTYVGSNWEAFQASGAHRTVLDGSAAQTVSFSNPGTAGQSSFFHHLEIANTAGGVTFASGAVANGALRVTTAATVTGAGTITVGDSLVTIAASALTPAGARLGGGMAVAGTFGPTLTEFFGAAQSIQGGLGYQSVLVTGQARLAGPATFAGDLTIARIVNQPTGDLDLNGQTLTVAGNLRTGQGGDPAGRLTMQTPADLLIVQGNATFAGDPTPARLTAGELRLGGDFRQQYVGSNWGAFAPTGTHRVVLDGTADQTILFDSPAGAPGQVSFFHSLTLAKPSGTVTLLSAAAVNGVFEADTQVLLGAGNALSAAGVNAVNNLVLDHVLLTIGSGPVTGFDNVTFQNYATASTQLTLVRSGGTFTFSGLRFLTTPTTGYYVSATDAAPADGDVLTVNLTNASPADGSARTLTSGGAVVTWSGPLTFAVVDQGLGFGCGLTTADAAYCWGGNADGQLGDGTTTQRTVPTAVAGGLAFTAISAGGQHTCGLDAAGLAYCWGSNLYGQLGDGSTTDRLTPVAVVGGLSYSAIAVGEQFTCAVQASTGLLYCWGRNTNGQLGDGTTTNRATLGPVEGVQGLTFASVSAAIGQHACAVTTTGVGYCWGRNTNGQLGDGTTTDQLTPVAVSGGLTFGTISASANEHTCGVTTGGEAWCWGWNSFGALGDGTTTTRLAPVAVSGGLTFATVSGGANGFTCGLTAGGAGYCWGLNNVGQLGDGTTTMRLTPVAVAGGLTFLQLSAGFAHVAAVAADGAGYAWGGNGSGQLGDGTTTARSTPTAMAPPNP